MFNRRSIYGDEPSAFNSISEEEFEEIDDDQEEYTEKYEDGREEN